MKLVQMQYSPDAFENFLRDKLEEVQPDPLQRDQLWEQFEQLDNQRGGRGNNNWFVAFALILVAATYYFSGSQADPIPTPVKAITVITPAQPQAMPENTSGMDSLYPGSEPVTVITFPQSAEADHAPDNSSAGPGVSAPRQAELTQTATIGIERPLESPAPTRITPAPGLLTTPVIAKDTATKAAELQKSKKKGPVYIIW